jgi:hypothetical protein
MAIQLETTDKMKIFKLLMFFKPYRMFMATRDTSVVIPPDATSIVSSVNFTTTRAGMTR